MVIYPCIEYMYIYIHVFIFAHNILDILDVHAPYIEFLAIIESHVTLFNRIADGNMTFLTNKKHVSYAILITS